MATSTFNAAELEVRRQLLREELAALETEKLKNMGGMQIVDFHHPERSPGWPIYRHQAFPQLLYHPSEKDGRIEEQRLGIRRRNEANPHLAPMDIPRSEPLTLKVVDATAKAAAMAQGFIETPPQVQMVDGNSPAELIGRQATNPLLDKTVPALSVETIIKLNQMSKDDLEKHALEVYGVTASREATKIDIITAIQKGQSDVSNLA